MLRLKRIYLTALLPAVLLSCDNNTPKHTDTLSSGTVAISADETFKPVIEQQLKVFDSSFPDAHIEMHYKPEAECYKDLIDKKAHLILVTRKLSQDERAMCDQKKIAPTEVSLAKDAVAVIVNKTSPDSLLGLDELKGILTGTYTKKYTVVFDNQGSSTVNFIVDSLLHGATLGKNVFAAKTNDEVVKYVENNPDAIGFVGLGYVSSTLDTGNTGNFIQSVKVVGIRNDSAQQFYQPYQAYIALHLYPLTRRLYYINGESYPGLGTGFANFLAGDRGQLIFAHAHLFPLKMNIVIRDAEINH